MKEYVIWGKSPENSNLRAMNREIAKLVLSRPNGFHAWDFPAGKSNVTRRVAVIGEFLPELIGKRGSVPVAKASVENYRKAILTGLCQESWDSDRVKLTLTAVISDGKVSNNSDNVETA